MSPKAFNLSSGVISSKAMYLRSGAIIHSSRLLT